VEPLLVFPDTPPGWLSSVLDGAGYPGIAVAGPSEAERREPEDGWAGAVVAAEEDVDGSLAAALAFCRVLRKREEPLQPLLLAVPRSQLAELDFREDLFDDFILLGSSVAEMDARLNHLLGRTGRGKQHDLIIYGPLALNLETYQAALSGRPLDLTFMEYELLRFLAARPGKVFTREVLLSRVWGYEYYGGARTVDVHIRRLRAKLGEEQAHLIDTVRSVGYRFGAVRWLPPAGGPGSGGSAGSAGSGTGGSAGSGTGGSAGSGTGGSAGSGTGGSVGSGTGGSVGSADPGSRPSPSWSSSSPSSSSSSVSPPK
jgi:DNA-binding response OmpR family regulator